MPPKAAKKRRAPKKKDNSRLKAAMALAGRKVGAVLLGLAALGVALSLAWYSAADPSPLHEVPGAARNLLGLPGAALSAVAYDLFGLGAWLLVLVPLLAAWLLWSGGARGRMLPLWAAGLGLVVSLAALLGAVGGSLRLGGAPLPVGGGAGRAMAQGLAALWPWLAWLLPLAALAAGLGLLAWSLWPLLGPKLKAPAVEGPLATNGALQPLEPYEPAPEPVAEPEPEVDIVISRPEPGVDELAPGPKPAPAPRRSKADGDGPVIKPRLAGGKAGSGTVMGGPKKGRFKLPALDLLDPGPGPAPPEQVEAIKATSRLLEEKLADFGVKGAVREVAPGPVVTRYEFKPAPGVKISKVAGLADDLAMVMRAKSIRIVAPIPGKAVIGIEIPNPTREMVALRELLSAPVYQRAGGKLTVALGKDILGQPMVADLARMPHLLIAGATGAGKSVFINCLVLSILYRATPEQVRILMVDPKRIELSAYSDIPHLLYPIITSPKEATAGLRWAVREMERRYELLAEIGVKNIESFNKRLADKGPLRVPEHLADGSAEFLDPLPYVLLFIDELADLMMVSSKEVEGLITRLAQMARAAGIHLVLATQRPSVDVITGLIKANFPSRISFKVASRVDSRTILDQQGAEHLLGNGDMLYVPPDSTGLSRLHGAFVSEEEIDRVTGFWKAQAKPEYDESVVEATEDEGGGEPGSADDELYPEAVALVRESGQASISYVQRRLKVGYNRAANLIEQMERDGIVGPSEGSKPRQVLMRD
ncbi:MAG: DNA translocase FtsK 4TM domain-containing protein [Desulfarculaceae bacterium]|nr:DNA translocase FtsK 4TM domain-containing protein [Desulfarculaceae bacterium]MCF8074413.1 DNA translocase FtsK 4TM domain-containing protein [Desulfarculaceae bacterium]MCF8103611.1 DNA translocase FtsK 4TM domain-containing protein [Desulfarculaceae bacterium]MCF8116024.1 DNA translocase FtsK 4TM domain-containing protein [Desulfarculaceae bacterium]